jgi:hypothetical protein
LSLTRSIWAEEGANFDFLCCYRRFYVGQVAGPYGFIGPQQAIIAQNHNYLGRVNYCVTALFIPKSRKTKLGHYQKAVWLDFFSRWITILSFELWN